MSDRSLRPGFSVFLLVAAAPLASALSGCLAPYFGDEDGDGDGVPYLEDCDDADPFVLPGGEEICDGQDNDCDGLLPEEELDADGDGVAPCEGDVGACDQDPTLGPVDADGDGVTTCDGDCNDLHPGIHPGHAEVEDDGLDNDCDGVLAADETDGDGDGYSAAAGDCDDTDPAVSPGRPEVACGGLDDDCDGLLDPSEVDNDGDGTSECDGDCDDGNAGVSPGAAESACNGRDDDCDGALAADESDLDGDGWTRGCPQLNPGGSEVDCDDAVPEAYPRETDETRLEVCGNGANDDCDAPLSGDDPVVFADAIFIDDFDNAGAGDLGLDQREFIDVDLDNLVVDTDGERNGAFRLTRDSTTVQGRVFGIAPVAFPSSGVAFTADIQVQVPAGSPGFAVVLVPADPFLEDPAAWGGAAVSYLDDAASGAGSGLGFAGLAAGLAPSGRGAIAVAFRSSGNTVTLEDGGPDRTLASAPLPYDIDTGEATRVSLDFRQDAAAGTVAAVVVLSRGGWDATAVTLSLPGGGGPGPADLGFPSDAWYVGVTATDGATGGDLVPLLEHVALTCD
ncbi:hypothetical protein L6R50_23935 [Myxococcota bacterium]|nr:hypothetical protein [Myxococcota bacterium]